ncbi:40S ribosomal protein S3a [Tupaia chinensis]|uniref:40S ribosomal protein S3a n=1 Tax=Tupaia chinensis TaxID=246437 RepID=L9KYD6_TUPCH|nr:40S ribosomal protein S3a [Tupaia chinensis]
MMEIMTGEMQTNNLKQVVNKLIPDSIGKDTEKAHQSIHPLHDAFIRKVKMLKKPKFELGKLMELHGESSSSGKATGDETDSLSDPFEERVVLPWRFATVLGAQRRSPGWDCSQYRALGPSEKPSNKKANRHLSVRYLCSKGDFQLLENNESLRLPPRR